MVLTARDTLTDKLRAFATGADDYLVKPFAFDELLARLAAFTRRRTDRKIRTWSSGRWRSTSARGSCAAGKEIRLSAREYAVLELLAGRAGQIVSRREIAARLFGSARAEEQRHRSSNLCATRAGGRRWSDTHRDPARARLDTAGAVMRSLGAR